MKTPIARIAEFLFVTQSLMIRIGKRSEQRVFTLVVAGMVFVHLGFLARAGTLPSIDDLPLHSTLTKDGITWTFNRAVPIGTFVNGDLYVVGPVTVTNIDPLPTLANGRHGSVLNMPGSNNAISPFDSRVTGNRYKPEYRVYPPFDMNPGDTLMSSISIGSRGEFPAWMREGYETPESYVRSVSVLTCLEIPVRTDAFRPAYVDRTQHLYYADDLNRALLPTLPKVGSVPSVEIMAFHFSRPWLEVCYFGFDAAVEYQAVYGREVGRAAGMATLLLMLDFTPAQKESLLVNFIQYGIDLWGLAKAGYPGWPAHGGHGSGRKWPILFAGIMLGDDEMKHPNATFPDLRFGEDMHTGFASCWTGADAVYTGHQGLWDGSPVSSQLSWGPYEHMLPSQWPVAFAAEANWHIGEDYRRCCTSIAWVGQALAARLMGAETLWNHPPFFAYVNRWMTEDDTSHVATILASTGRDYSANFGRQKQAWDPFVNQMWAAYANNRPPMLSPIGTRSAEAGNPLSITVEAADPDNDPLTFSATGTE